MTARGIFHTINRARQLLRFDNLRWGSATPSDIDAAIEFDDRLYVFVEAKSYLGQLQTGQRILLTRIADGLQTDTRHAFVLLAQHTTKPDEDVMLDRAIVQAYYYKRTWHTPQYTTTVKAAIDTLRNQYL